MKKITNIVFDLGDVLINDIRGLPQIISKEVGFPAAEIEKHLYNGTALELFRGKMSEDDYWGHVISEYSYPAVIGGLPAAEFLKRTVRANFTKVPGTIAIAEFLKDAGFRLAILSDHGREWTYYIEENFPLKHIFLYRFYSFESGYVKRDEMPFKKLFRTGEFDLSSTLFIDDYDLNLAAAKRSGIVYVHQFKKAKDLWIYLLQDVLRERMSFS